MIEELLNKGNLKIFKIASEVKFTVFTWRYNIHVWLCQSTITALCLCTCMCTGCMFYLNSTCRCSEIMYVCKEPHHTLMASGIIIISIIPMPRDYSVQYTLYVVNFGLLDDWRVSHKIHWKKKKKKIHWPVIQRPLAMGAVFTFLIPTVLSQRLHLSRFEANFPKSPAWVWFSPAQVVLDKK